MHIEYTIPVLAIAAAACITDITSRRIPNMLTFGAAAGAVIVRGTLFGSAGVIDAAAGWLTGFLILFPLFFVRGLGAGDVKLVAALGAWVGPIEAVWMAMYASLCGGIVGIGYA